MNNTLKYSLAYGFLAVVVVVILTKKATAAAKNLVPEQEDPALSKKYNLHLIPGGKANYRSAQISAADLPYILKKYGIKRVIRLNSESGDDARGVSGATEKKICEENGVQYIRLSAHDGYVKNQGYVTSVNNAKSIMDQGNTLIHCAWGSDRTGGLVGGYLKKAGIMTDIEKLWTYTTAYNGWISIIKKRSFFGTGFDKYADCFYPIDQLKRKYSSYL